MAGKKQPAPTRLSKGGASKPTNSSSSRTLKPAQAKTESRESEEDLKRQQTLLNIFSDTFREVLQAEDFGSQLQEVKGALFNRDFEGAFAREAALDVYAARWSPTRALCYARILRGLDAHLKGLVGGASAYANYSPDEKTVNPEKGDGHESPRDEQNGDAVNDDPQSAEEREVQTIPTEQEDSGEENKTQPLRIIAIGGAAAEIVAFADYISSQATTKMPLQGEITLLDIGPWESVTSRLQTALTTTPPISRYASAAAKAANAALVPPSRFHSTFIQKDILSLPEAELVTLIPKREDGTPILITLLFTLNELYTAGGIKRTTAFLRLLSSPTISLAPGSLLLVVDSPGSYSEAAVGGKDVKKRYPMQWLLEHTLIPPPASRKKKPGQVETEDSPPEGANQQPDVDAEKGEEEEKNGIRWEKIESHDSVWFRVAEGLRYPIPLENMRYQMHLYRAYVG